MKRLRAEESLFRRGAFCCPAGAGVGGTFCGVLFLFDAPRRRAVFHAAAEIFVAARAFVAIGHDFSPPFGRFDLFLPIIAHQLDSDNAVSRVVASVPVGPWAGAALYSQDARLAGKGMDIHFDRMMWRGMFLKVNAYALNEHTGMSSVASDVNHRWFKHIVLPSVLGGVGSVGSLYKDANTQVIQGNYGSITGRVGMPDGEALAGVIAGGMAERGSQLLTRQAESEPYRQVTVSRGEVVSILFVEPVMSNDISPPSSGTAPSVPPPSGRPLTQEEAERQASDRIQAAVMRKQNEMRQRYGIQQESHP